MPNPAPNPMLHEATSARDATALTRAGIQLPAMDVRTSWADPIPDDPDHDAAPVSARYALVRLASAPPRVCSAPVALALAAVIAKGAAAR